MIKKIRLKNFQSHKDSELNFSEGINAIIGKTDSGKSSVIRALNWVINNKPSGDSIRAHNTDITSVEITDGDGNKIRRQKGKNSNSYFLNDEEYTAFGQNVPDEILSVLNFKDINLQKQFQEHFLLADPPGQRANYLNAVIGLDIIEKGLSNVDKMRRRERSEMRNDVQQLSEFSDELVDYDWVDGFEKKIKKFEKKATNFEKDNIRLEKIQDLSLEISGLKKKIDEFERRTQFESRVSCIEEKIRVFKYSEEEKEKYEEIVKWIKNNLKKSAREERIIKFEKKAYNITKGIERLQKEKRDFHRLGAVLDRVLSLLSEENKIDSKLERLIITEKEVFGQMEMCPVCGSNLKKEEKDE